MKKLKKFIKESTVIQVILIILGISFLLNSIYDIIFEDAKFIDIYYLTRGYIGGAIAALLIGYWIWRKKAKP